MASNEEDLWYIQHHTYNYVIRHYNKAIDYKHYEEEPLDNIWPHMRILNDKLEKDDYIVKTFFKLLSNSVPFMEGMTPNYCKYINLWLNKEYLKEKNQTKIPDFDFFRTFVNKLNYEKNKNQENTCEKYIKLLDTKIYNNINFLHGLYDIYNKIEKPPVINSEYTCGELDYLAKNYRDTIDEYYDKDKNFYKNVDYIKKKILEKLGNIKPPCVNNIYFSTPKEEARKNAEEEARKKAVEDARKEAQEQARRRTVEEDRERQEVIRAREGASSRHLEQELKAKKELLQRPENNNVDDTASEKGTSEHAGEQRGLLASVISELGRNSQRIESPEIPESSTEFLLENEYAPQGQIRYTIEGTEEPREVNNEQEYKGPVGSGTFFDSLRLPGYITEVLGSVEPAPVLGVSGGMGALFLLFKYTPVGTFFGRRRGRAHGIPRSFNGQFLGGFPGYEEFYDVGFGNGPINISYRPELE